MRVCFALPFWPGGGWWSVQTAGPGAGGRPRAGRTAVESAAPQQNLSVSSVGMTHTPTPNRKLPSPQPHHHLLRHARGESLAEARDGGCRLGRPLVRGSCPGWQARSPFRLISAARGLDSSHCLPDPIPRAPLNHAPPTWSTGGPSMTAVTVLIAPSCLRDSMVRGRDLFTSGAGTNRSNSWLLTALPRGRMTRGKRRHR